MSLQKSFLIIFASIMVLMVGSLLLILEVIDNEELIAAAEARRYKSYLLADELRQSSDDLTRMARVYSITGDPQYKEYFERILAIRNGKAPRPLEYQGIYWDFIVATGREPRVSTDPKALKALMKEAEFTETEFALLQETENESNELVNLENLAMNAMVGLFDDGSGYYTKGEPDYELARNLLHGKEYHQAKAKIMKPLEKFFDTLDQRTSGEMAVYREKQYRLNLVLMITLGLSVLLVASSVIMAAVSLNKKETDTGRSRLAQRLAASGYPSPSPMSKGSGRERMAKRLSAMTSQSSGDEKQGEPKGDTALLFFIRNFWNDWPLIVAAVVITFMTLGLSWWFLSENKALSYTNASDELESSLDATHSTVLDWLDRSNLDVTIFSDAISRRISNDILPELKNNPNHTLHQQLKNVTIAESQIFENYILTDLNGIVLSSNRTVLIGRYFAFPEGTMEQIQTPPYYRAIHFPRGDENEGLLSQNILFGALLEDNKGAVFFTVSPQSMLSKILRRGYTADYGEIYLVNAEGRFVSENRWKERMVEEHWIPSNASSIVGMTVSQNRNASRPVFPLSVKNVIKGETGEQLDAYKNYLGDKVVGAWRWDNTYGFGIINELNNEAAFAAYRSYKNQALAGSGFTVVLILALTLMSIWSRSKVTKAGEELKGAFTTIKKHNDKLAQDLQIGQKVQTDMLPDPIKGDGFALEAFLKPAQSVSGDFYDFSILRDDKVYFCVGDVSGKGVPAALFMAITKAFLNKVLDQTYQTKDIMDRVNNELSLNNDSNMFVTLILGIMDLRTGSLLITNGGHNLPFIKKKSGELVCLDEIQGPLVGTFEGMEYGQQSIQMSEGDIVLFYTDGVTEALNVKDEFYEDERLESLLRQNEFATAQQMTSTVFRSVTRFIGRADQFDDITILSFQYKGL